MDPQSIYLQANKVPELIDKLILRLVEDQPNNARQHLRDQLYAMVEERFEGGDNALEMTMPALNPKATTRQILLSKALNLDMFKKVGKLRTNSGVGIDDCIVDGLAYHSSAGESSSTSPTVPPYGFLVGDAESFTLFGELIDALLAQRYGAMIQGPGGKPFIAPKSELQAQKITTGFQYEERFLVGACVKLRRNIATFRMSCCMTRAERRFVSNLLQKACVAAFQHSSSTTGKYYPAASFASNAEKIDKVAHELRLPAVPSILPWCSKASTEWPDGRGSYISTDALMYANVLSEEEHVEIGTRALRSGDVRDAFERAAQCLNLLQDALKQESQAYEWQSNAKFGYLMSNLDHFYGYGLSVHFVMRLPLLSHHKLLPSILTKLKLQRREPKFIDDPTDIIVVDSNIDERPFTATEADLVQLSCASAAKLIELEHILLNGGFVEGKY